MPVYMLIIGKILEGNHMYLSMIRISVHSGKLKTSYKLMLMDVNMNTDVSTHMDGRNRSIILIIIRCMHVDNKIYVQSHIVHIFILIRIGDRL
jgi:hypothetical protein